MITKEKLIITGLILIILSLFGYLLFWQEKETKIVYVDRETADTTIKFVIKYPEPIRIEGKAKIIYREIEIPVNHTILDTIIETKPFTATLDTIVRDTFNIRFDYPENIFSFVLRQAPDTLELKTITIIRDVEKPEPWYWKPLYAAGGLIIGYGMGQIK